MDKEAKSKSRIEIIMGKMAGGKKDDKDEEDSSKEGMKATMSEFIDAVKSGDVDGALEAFCSLKDQHDEGGYKSDDKDDKEEEDEESDED